jgi:NitT/TauT family transport system substrate-binding protein
MRSVSLGLFFVLLFPVASAAQKTADVTMGYVGIDVQQLPAWMAKEAGIFQKNGLDVQLVNFTGGPTAIAALLSGDVPFTQVSGPSVVSSHLRGSDAVFVVGGTVTLDFWLMSRPEIRTPEQLRGGTIGIGRFGGVNDAMLRFLLPKLGLAQGTDVSVRQVGGVPVRLAALEAGQIQASLLSPPITFVALKRGLHLLADVAALGMVYQHTTVATTRKFIRERPETVRRFVRSHVEAVHRLKTDREMGIKVLGKYIRGISGRDVLEKSYDRAVTDNALPRKQYPTLEGIKVILDGLADQELRAKTARPEEFVDMRFVAELDQSGYIDGLYRRNILEPYRE